MQAIFLTMFNAKDQFSDLQQALMRARDQVGRAMTIAADNRSRVGPAARTSRDSSCRDAADGDQRHIADGRFDRPDAIEADDGSGFALCRGAKTRPDRDVIDRHR